MEASSIRRTADPIENARRIDLHAAWTWLLCFGLIVVLGLKGGGYDPLVHDQIGIAVWWVLVATMLVGAIPRLPMSRLGWSALGLLALFAIWIALSLLWTESIDRTSLDLARVVTYVGILGLALFSGASRERHRVVAAVGAGIVLVASIALLSRLHPAWFPAARQSAGLLSGGRERLSYPLNYWNALAALVAIGLPLILQLATSARSVLARGLSAAALPVLALTAFFTLSRGGIGTAIVALVVFLAFASNRLPKLLTLVVASGGSAILILAAAQRDALQHGFLNATARHQGTEMLWMTLAVCLAVGVIQAAITLTSRRTRRPTWTLITRRRAQAGVAVCVLVAIIAALAIDAPSRLSSAWTEFKGAGPPGSGANRLTSAAGQNRYQYWSAAVEENATKPLTGTGSGTFEYWWSRNGSIADTIRDTHSLYFQTLGEIGIVGLILLTAFLLTVLIGGGVTAVRAVPADRAVLAAALAGSLSFFLTAAVDWMWQVPVLPVAMLLLASALLSPGPGSSTGDASLRIPVRLGFVFLSLVVIAVIAIPLASTSLLRQSEADVRSGDLPAALSAARSAQNVQPGAASPRLQQALVLEIQGKLREAGEAAKAATARESTNWRTWMVLSRIEAERGHADAAIRDYRMARSLNPRSSLFRH